MDPSHTPFEHVVITGLAHVDAPNVLTTEQVNAQLQATREKLGIRTDVLGQIAGIQARRLWNEGTQAADVGTQAGAAALADAGLTAPEMGLLINTSVSRDYLEPATAAIVAGQLGVAGHCQTFDIANACLAFVSGMDVAARMIERGEIQHALVVDGETAEHVYAHTLARLVRAETTEEQFRDELAALTLGSGAVAMVLSRREHAPEAPRYRGGVNRSATQWHALCRGNLDRMTTDTRALLTEGMRLAGETFAVAQATMGWTQENIDHFVIHQVSRPHTQAFLQGFEINPDKVLTLFGQHGNLGPASVPTALSKLREAGKLERGQRIALMGIGSGLNCMMAEIQW